MEKWMPKILLWLKPFVMWFDKMFTIPFSVKKVNADHYFMWKPRLVKGMAFITDTHGQGSNLLNPSKGKHGAIYFGTGLKSHLDKLISVKGSFLGEHFLSWYDANKGNIHDDVEYVIESLGHGVTATSVIKFLTTKDVVLGFVPLFTNAEGMAKAAVNSVYDLGIPYDYEFNQPDNAKYCFEVIVDAYLKENPKLNFVMEDYFGYDVYTASAFKDEKMWKRTIDSEKEFPELYKK